MSKIIANNLTFHYWRMGQGQDIVMLHGMLGNLAVWHLKIAPMLQRDFCVTTYDLRGHGFSDMPPDGYTTLDMTADLEALLDALGMEQICLVGHSFGADIAMHFALLHPQRVTKLVLIEPGLAALVHERKRDEWEGWAYWARKLAEAGIQVPPEKHSDFRYLLNLSLETPTFYGPAKSLPRKREPLLRLINATTLVEDYEAIGGMTIEKIREIEPPMLIVYGSNSHFLGTYRFLREALPQASTLLLPGGEHFGPLEQPKLLVEHIRHFLLVSERTDTVLLERDRG